MHERANPIGFEPMLAALIPLPGLLAELDVPILAIDTSSRVIWANPACALTFGMAAERIIGLRPPFPHWHPDDAARLTELWRRIGSGEALAAGERRVDYAARTRQGREFRCVVIHDALPDTSGRVRGYLCVARPIGSVASLFTVHRRSQKRSVVLERLSPREREVVTLLLDGFRVPSIGRRLFISPHTVRNHLKSVFRRLGVESQAELIERVMSSDSRASANEQLR